MAALSRMWIASPNYSSRGGADVRLIVIHTAEGATTIESLGSFFANPSTDASSQVGIDDKPGVIGEYVRPGNKAWTQASYNPVAVSAELCAFAKWSTAEWNKHPTMLENCARWIAEEAERFSIPLTSLTDQQAQSNGRGVCQHENLGSGGGGHWDCGTSFPLDKVLEMARGGTTDEEEDEMGYPPWTYPWIDWYVNTDRDPAKRPPGTPKEIPDWAWDAQKEVEAISKRFGMTAGERDWIDWLAAGKKGERPNVPQTIPDHWWDDNKWAADRG
jgi:hypothetical protein